MRRPGRRTWVGVWLVAAIAGCGGSAGPSMVGSTPTALAAPSAVSSPPGPTPAPPAASSPASSPLPSLQLAWQRSGPIVGRTITYWPAIDPKTGDIWVADSWHDQYWIFKPDGTFVSSWGSSGSGRGQFHLTTNDPNPDAVGAIAFAPDGSFFVADEGNHRVQAFDPQRGFVTEWGSFGTGQGQFVQAKGIETDGKLVYVTDDPRGDLQVFKPDGTFVTSFPFPFVLFALDAAGHPVTAGGPDGDVLVFDKTGQQLASYTYAAGAIALGGMAGQVAVDRAGDMLIPIDADPDGPKGLLKLDPAGKLVDEWSSPCGSATMSPDGTALYCAYDGPPDGGWPYIRKYVLPGT